MSAIGRADPASANGTRALAVALPEELIEAIAVRAAEIVANERRQSDNRWLRGADRIARYLDCPRSRVYALVSARRIPIHHDGSALIALRSELDRWLREGGGVRP
jgi:excisionase family DNA binding protein